MDIKKKVSSLQKKYKTNNPFDVIRAKNILLLYEELGLIKGYYNLVLRQKQIHINCNLSRHEQHFTCAHELGHALLHPNANTPFLRSKTYMSIEKLEIEANTFAAELLIPDSLIYENPGMTKNQLARLAGYNEKIMDFKRIG